jgi:hypothetical protein
MKSRFALLLITLMTLTATQSRAFAQDYLYEFGVSGGMSVTYGDLNKSKLFYKPGFAGSAQFRYNHNLRWAFAASLDSYGLKGDSWDFDNHYPSDTHYWFDCRLWQLTLRPEFSFRNYGWGNDFREKQRLVPFVTAGIGLGLTSSNNKFVFFIPVGAGFKWKVAPRWNVQATWLFTKTFSDATDGIDDPYGIESGAMKNTDWVGTLSVGISYSFGLRCVTCNSDRQ